MLIFKKVITISLLSFVITDYALANGTGSVPNALPGGWGFPNSIETIIQYATSPNGNVFRVGHYCKNNTCQSESQKQAARYIKQLDNLRDNTYFSSEAFENELDTFSKKRYTEIALDEEFSEEAKDIIKNGLFSPYNRQDQTYGSAVISEIPNTPYEFLYSRFLKEYQDILNEEDDATISYFSEKQLSDYNTKIMAYHNILSFLKSKIGEKKVTSCLYKTIKKSTKIECSHKSIFEWEEQILPDVKKRRKQIATKKTNLNLSQAIAIVAPVNQKAKVPRVPGTEEECYLELIENLKSEKVISPRLIANNEEDINLVMDRKKNDLISSKAIVAHNLKKCSSWIYTTFQKANITYAWINEVTTGETMKPIDFNTFLKFWDKEIHSRSTGPINIPLAQEKPALR